jgi:hypothetical protein
LLLVDVLIAILLLLAVLVLIFAFLGLFTLLAFLSLLLAVLIADLSQHNYFVLGLRVLPASKD